MAHKWLESLFMSNKKELNKTGISEFMSYKKKAKICAIIWTFVYILFFPFLCYSAMLSFMVFDRPNISTPLGLSIIFIIFLIPLSLPLSVDLMWSSFICKEYKKVLFLWTIPFLTIILVLILNAIIQTLFLW